MPPIDAKSVVWDDEKSGITWDEPKAENEKISRSFPKSIMEKIRMGLHPVQDAQIQSQLASEAQNYPKVPIQARTALEGIGTMIPGPAAIPGYVAGKKLSNIAEAAAGTRPTSIMGEIASLPQDVSEGVQNWAIGSAIGKGIEYGAKGLSKLAPKLYESALKIPPSVDKKIRGAAVKTGIEGEYAVSSQGLRKLDTDITTINKSISSSIDDFMKETSRIKSLNKKAGYNKYIVPEIHMQDVVTRLDQLKSYYKQLPPGRAKPFIEDIDEIGRQYLTQKEPMSLGRAQEMKQAIYRLNKKHYGDMKSTAIEADKAIARGLKEEIVNIHPELKNLNVQDSALLNLETVLERAVNRSRNYDVIKLGDQIVGVGGAVMGGPAGAATAGMAKHFMEAPAVKSRLAFALNKAGRKTGFEKTGKALAFGLPKYQVFDGNFAEAATLSDYARGGETASQRAMRDAAGDNPQSNAYVIPEASTAQQRTSSVPTMSREQRLSYEAATERMRREQETRGKTPAKKAHIDVRQVTVQTKDGEELRYIDKKTGKIYKEDPND